MPRAKSSRSKSRKNDTAFYGALAGTVLTVLALIITLALQDMTLTTSSEAARAKRTCSQPCRTDSQCADGLLCRPNSEYGGRTFCTCTSGTCISGQCKAIVAEAELGSECDREMTQDSRKGIVPEIPSLACKEGLSCDYVTRLVGGSSFVCCDPTNPDVHPNCKSDPIQRTAPRP